MFSSLFLAVVYLVERCLLMKPIVLMHGAFVSHHTWDYYIEWIREIDNSTIILNSLCYEKLKTLENLMKQEECLSDEIHRWKTLHDIDSYNLICHSMGSVTCRAFIEFNDNHGVDNWISLTSFLSGMYGFPKTKLPKWMMHLSLESVTMTAYTKIMQETDSLANVWNDPFHQDWFLDRNTFLPFINNEITHPDSERFKKNFLSTKNMHLFGSPADEVIIPWNSAIFGFFKIGSKEGELVDMESQWVYKNDSFGLRTMDEQNRLQRTVVQDVHHTGWGERKDIFDEYILPIIKG